MALFDDASLVVTPNGYKAGTLYSIKPTSGLGDMTVVRATTATRVNSAGLIESVANNVPRLDYLNASCPSLLVEQQRTNIQIKSEDFSNAIYLPIGVTVTTNTTVAPDGNTTADRITEDSSTGFHTIDILNPPASAGTHTVSVFVKANGRTKFQILGFFSLTGNVDFNLTTGTATTTAPALNGKIENYGNGWFRCQATFTDLTGVNAQILFNILNNAGNNNYTGDGTSGLIFWGAQIELGTYATSYIPTTTATVTRNADDISKTGISSLIGQTEGTLFAEISAQVSTDNNWFQILDGTSNNLVLIGLSADKIRAFIRFGATTIFDSNTFVLTNGVSYKAAIAYKNGDMVFYINGAQILTSSASFTITAPISYLAIGFLLSGPTEAAKYKQGAIFPTRLTNTELAQLTTL